MFYMAFKTKIEGEALVLSLDSSRDLWCAAMGNYSVSGDLKSILRDPIWQDVPNVVISLEHEVYNDDLMIIRHGANLYEVMFFSLLIEECGTMEQIAQSFSVRQNADILFEGIDTKAFKPDGMAQKLYTAILQTGGDQ